MVACTVEAVDYHWEGSPLLQVRRRQRPVSRERSTAGSTVAGSILSPQQRLTQQRRNRAVAQRNNAAFEQPARRQRLYDRVRKRAQRLSHGGTVAPLSAHEERFWARLARPARQKQKAAAAKARGLESSSLRPVSAGTTMGSSPTSSPATVQLRPWASSRNPHVPKQTGRRRQAGIGDLAQIQMARHASTLAYRDPGQRPDENDDATRWPHDPPAYDPELNLSPKALSTQGGYRYRRDTHGFVVPCARGAYYLVRDNPDPVRRSAQAASVVEFVMVKQKDGQARISHLARHPRTLPPEMPGNFERWQWYCAIYIQRCARGYICRARFRALLAHMRRCEDCAAQIQRAARVFLCRLRLKIPESTPAPSTELTLERKSE
jgi:hypothetical protein